MELSNSLKEAVEQLRQAELDASNGLPQELFLFVSALVPLPNVDLLIVNAQKQILLSRRNDGFFQKSWHIPGGCMRYGETFENRIQETARHELGSFVHFETEPIAVRNVIRGINPRQEHPMERGHNVAILFRCTLPDDYKIDNHGLGESDNGYLKWFDTLPDDFMQIQNVYADILTPWMK